MKELFMVDDSTGRYEIFDTPAEGFAFAVSKCIEIAKDAKLSAEETFEVISEMCDSYTESGGKSFYSEGSFYGFPANYHNRER